jgi:aspartyl-tRNA(Asn)/glutamyl-tRNA(Gln) amidotransferase subunit A
MYSNHLDKIDLVKKGKISLIDEAKKLLNQIEEKKILNCYNFVFSEIENQAKQVEEKIKSNSAGKLAGMVIAVKDVIAIKDKPLTCSSKILKDFISIYDASVIEKIKSEDALIIGKTNCDEFAMGSSNENSAFGPVLNPYDHSRVPGGSSGGSAVAVAANLCDASLGTDTGGSIRQPASFCGIYGLKPTYGRVSRFGLTAFASSFDTIGPFAKNIYDLSLLFSVIAFYDPKDSTSANVPFEFNASDLLSLKNLKDIKNEIIVGLPEEYFGEGLDKEIKDCVEKFALNLENIGVKIKNINLPNSEYAIPAYYVLTTAEASSNLERYDGVKYGYRSKNSRTLNEMYAKTRAEGFGSEVKRRIMLGTFVLSSGYYDAYYKKAQKARKLIKQDFDKAFSEVDFILTPTSPTCAFKLGEKKSNPLEMYLSDIYTTSANLAGIPAINIPIGFNKQGLPIGAQILSNSFEERKLLQFCYIVEKELQIKTLNN